MRMLARGTRTARSPGEQIAHQQGNTIEGHCDNTMCNYSSIPICPNTKLYLEKYSHGFRNKLRKKYHEN